jgi:hypothetical protein
MTEDLIDGAHAIWPLGMSESGVVLGENRVRDEQGCHDPDRSFPGSVVQS